MTGKTYIMGGVAACVTLANVTHYDPAILTAAGAAGSLLPDICHGGSKIGRKFPILSKVINVLFGHRTFTHSLLF
jgi:inner membrane protein